MRTETNKTIAVSTAILGAFAFLFAFRLPVPDIAFSSVRLGEFFLKKGSFPAPAQLSFIPTNANWVDTSWLFDIISFVLYRLGGELTLRMTAGVLTALATILLYKAQPSLFLKPSLSYAITICLLMIMNHSLEFKPLLITVFFFSLQCYMLQKNASRKSSFFILYLIWANCDIGFIAGIIYLIFHTLTSTDIPVQSKIKIPLFGTAGGILSYSSYQILSNPNYIKLFFEPAPDFHISTNRIQALWVLAGLASAALCKNDEQPSIRSSASALTAAFAISLLTGRYLPVAVITSYQLLPVGLQEFLRMAKIKGNRWLDFVMTALTISLFILLLPAEKKNAERNLMQFLSTHSFFGEISAPLEIGGKTAFITHKKACMESLFGLYNAQSAVTYRTIFAPWNEEWDKIAAGLKIGGIIVKRKEKSYYAVAQKNEWALIFQNEKYALFIKKEGMNTHLVSKWGELLPAPEPRLSEEEQMVKAQKWLNAGNPYRARWELLTLLQENPTNKTANELLKKIENQIQKADKQIR